MTGFEGKFPSALYGSVYSELREADEALSLLIVLVGVPVETRLFEDKPVLPPFLGEVAFSVLLFP